MTAFFDFRVALLVERFRFDFPPLMTSLASLDLL